MSNLINFSNESSSSKIDFISNKQHCIKYSRIRVFTDPYSPVYLRFWSYTGEYVSVETRILAYFMQCKLLGSLSERVGLISLRCFR